MARAIQKDGILRNCPTCDTPVADAKDLGLRDYRWVDEELPGKVGLMDFDAVLSQSKSGRMLVLELKPKGAYISIGARLTFQVLVKEGKDVWVIWDLGKGRVKLGECNDTGRPQNVREMTRKRAAVLVRKWWEKGL